MQENKIQVDKIQMVDLVAQYQNIKSEIDTAIMGVIENAQFINGPEVAAFQKDR